jgi:hypothetical protein
MPNEKISRSVAIGWIAGLNEAVQGTAVQSSCFSFLKKYLLGLGQKNKLKDLKGETPCHTTIKRFTRTLSLPVNPIEPFKPMKSIYKRLSDSTTNPQNKSMKKN